MSIFHKLDYNKMYRLGKKVYKSKEMNFLRKNIANRKFYSHLAKDVGRVNVKKVLSDPNTYKKISKGIQKVRDINTKIGNAASDISPELGLFYGEVQGPVEYGLAKAQQVSSRTGRTIQRVKKSKSPLEKGVAVTQSLASTGRDFL